MAPALPEVDEDDDARRRQTKCGICHRPLKQDNPAGVQQHNRSAYHLSWATWRAHPDWEWRRCTKAGKAESDRLWHEWAAADDDGRRGWTARGSAEGGDGPGPGKGNAKGKDNKGAKGTKDGKKKKKPPRSPVVDRADPTKRGGPGPDDDPDPEGGSGSRKERMLTSLWEMTLMRLT